MVKYQSELVSAGEKKKTTNCQKNKKVQKNYLDQMRTAQLEIKEISHREHHREHTVEEISKTDTSGNNHSWNSTVDMGPLRPKEVQKIGKISKETLVSTRESWNGGKDQEVRPWNGMDDSNRSENLGGAGNKGTKGQVGQHPSKHMVWGPGNSLAMEDLTSSFEEPTATTKTPVETKKKTENERKHRATMDRKVTKEPGKMKQHLSNNEEMNDPDGNEILSSVGVILSGQSRKLRDRDWVDQMSESRAQKDRSGETSSWEINKHMRHLDTGDAARKKQGVEVNPHQDLTKSLSESTQSRSGK